MLRHLLIIVLLLLSALRLQAQHLLGQAGSNRAGSNAVFLNPSAIADSRQGFYLNLFTGKVAFSNTYFHHEGSRLSPGKVLSEEGGDLFDRAYVRERLNDKPKLLHAGVDVQLPSFMLKLSPMHTIAFTTRFRVAGQAHGVAEDLAQVIGFGTSNPTLQNSLFTGREAYFNNNAFTEIGFTYARVLLSKEKRFLKGGITVKRVQGLYAAYLQVPGMDYQLLQNQAEEHYMQVKQGSARFGYSRSDFDLEGDEVLDAITNGNSLGSGWGIDLGLTYEHRPDFAAYKYTFNGEERLDHGENKYKYRIGAALLDVGSISYSDPQHVRRYDITRQNLDLDEDTFGDVDVDNLGSTLEEALQVQASERQTSFRSGLPTALHLNFDYRLSRRVFLNASVLQNLRGKEAVAMRQYSVLTVAPRFEAKALELAIPVSLINGYRDLALGAMLRTGPFLVGSDNLAALVRNGKAAGADLYVGVGIGIGTGGQRKKMEKQAQRKARHEARKSKKTSTEPVQPTNRSPAESSENKNLQ